ncbi:MULTISPECIES: polynucleotide adenylyltransferase PcnB [unclassified Psychrobacter]|uniref:polynucleotide adenylyltransferase PcnB n=1 Tax=unclassified Psychrobacter TaxID=196806 RepID=UPI003FD59B23
MAERAAKQLELNKSELPNSITEVIATLSRSGFDAYIVGGGVRDTLLGLRPKDFDAVTDAKPHEIKDVFGKRCRIIGRRFQLAHVYSGRELIEVATFRGPPTSDANTNQDGMILRDNVWGDIKQDFSRRDFSINALYYQPLKGVVHDFCGALDDIDNKVIRLLGHAPVRIEEDPVRLLRALRFKAKLGFEFDDELAGQFHESNWALLEQISPHRLYDETQKMFTGGYLVPLLPLLFESGAIDSLMIYPPAEPSPLVKQVAINTDKRIAAGKSINPAFFYAALLWENYLHQLEKAKNRNMPFADAQMHAAGKVIDRQRIKTAIPKFAEQFIRDIWLLQPKLAAPRTKQIVQLSEHPRFRAGFDFLLLREQCGDSDHPLSESTNGMGEWWQTYQTLSEKEQAQAIDDFDDSIRRGSYKQNQRSRGRNRQKQNDLQEQSHSNKHNDTDHNQDKAKPQETAPPMNDDSNVPTRRRRRRDDTQSLSTELQTSSTKPKQALNGKQLAKQDRKELALLKQLSLASSENKRAKSKSQPEPLLVIEHEKVVPPLQKQLEVDKSAKPKSRQVSAKNKASVADTESVDIKSVDKKSARDKETKSKPSDIALENKQASKASKESKQLPAQTPQLVTANNEPIPHKRRRRQPSTTFSDVLSKSDTLPTPKVASRDKNKDTLTDKAQTTNKEASKREAKTTKSKKLATPNQSNTISSQGPVPAKRRRRQPSTISTDSV